MKNIKQKNKKTQNTFVEIKFELSQKKRLIIKILNEANIQINTKSQCFYPISHFSLILLNNSRCDCLFLCYNNYLSFYHC